MYDPFSKVKYNITLYHVICDETEENIKKYCYCRRDWEFSQQLLYADGGENELYSPEDYYKDKAHYLATGKAPYPDFPLEYITPYQLIPYLTLDELVDMINPNTPADIVDRLLDYVKTDKKTFEEIMHDIFTLLPKKVSYDPIQELQLKI